MKITLIVTALLGILCCSPSYAGPAAPGAIDIAQPDGTSFKATILGDENQNWIEALESGHTVIQNRESGYWEYAEKQADGTLKGSGIKVDPSGKATPDSIPKGVRPERRQLK